MRFSLLLIFLFSCSFNGDSKSKLNTEVRSAKDLDENKSMIGWDMISLNSRLRPTLIRQENYSDFSGLTSEVYIKKMLQYQVPSDIEYIEYMSSKDIEIVLIGKDKRFVICTKSMKQKLVFCDDAYTPILEFSSTDTSIDLNEKIKEYI